MELLLATLVMCAVCGVGLGLGLLLRRGSLQGSCGGSVDFVDGQFVKKACGTCAVRTKACPHDGPQEDPQGA